MKIMYFIFFLCLDSYLIGISFSSYKHKSNHIIILYGQDNVLGQQILKYFYKILVTYFNVLEKCSGLFQKNVCSTNTTKINLVYASKLCKKHYAVSDEGDYLINRCEYLLQKWFGQTQNG